MDLIIVESPAKARTISRLLNGKYKVEACMGHIRDLPKTRLGINIKDNFTPRYAPIRERAGVIKELRRKSAGADRVLLAADPDREGEAICWHLVKSLGLKDNYYRITLDEITRTVLNEAVKKPDSINMSRVEAQQARRILDRIVGYMVSRILWSKAGKGLSAGRVQSVVLRLICEREAEIESFTPQEYWTVTAHLKNRRGEQFSARLEKISGKKAKITDESRAKEINDRLREKEFVVDSLQKKEGVRNPPPPFTTSTLQQEAAAKLNFGTSKTMAVAQQLYEGVETGSRGPEGLITYMRTDSVRISAEARGKCAKFIRERFGEEYARLKPRTYKSGKGAQEAHEAIRPTDVFKEPEKLKEHLTAEQHKLYTLIWKRFVASQAESARIDTLTAKISAGEFDFGAKGQTVRFPGFMIIYADPSEKYTPLPELEEKEKPGLVKIETKQNFTSPPPRYTEAAMVKTLEEKGIGRPSTYAPIIRTVQLRSYVQKEKGRLKPTELGRLVNTLLVNNFSEIFNVNFTARMEKELDEIEEGKEKWQDVVGEFYAPFEKSLEKAKTDMENVKKKMEKDTGQTCEKCGGKMVIKRGRYGEFVACANFPECKNSRALVKETGVACPASGCGGRLIEKRTRKGKVFYACDRYPECDFSLWNKPVPGSCPKCRSSYLIEKKRKKETVVACPSRDCDFAGKPAEGSAQRK